MKNYKLGDVIASLRRKNRIGQNEMAFALEISTSYLSQIENNAKKPSFKLLNKICIYLKTELSELLFLTLLTDKNDEFDDINLPHLFYKSKPLFNKMLGILTNL